MPLNLTNNENVASLMNYFESPNVYSERQDEETRWPVG